MTKRKPAMVWHPGEHIAEELAVREQWPEVLVSAHWNKRQIEHLLKCELPVDPWLAMHLHRIWGTSADFWLNLQGSWDEWPDRQSPQPTKEKAERSQSDERASSV